VRWANLRPMILLTMGKSWRIGHCNGDFPDKLTGSWNNSLQNFQMFGNDGNDSSWVHITLFGAPVKVFMSN
jgi:hypothetical protein